MCVQLKNTQNWSNRINNYMKESWGGCFLCIISYTNNSNCNDLITWWIEEKSNVPYSSHGSVVRSEVEEEHNIWEWCQVRENKEVVKSRRWSRSKVSQVCESHHLLLQFVAGSQRRDTVSNSLQQTRTWHPGCVSEWHKFSTGQLSAFLQGTSTHDCLLEAPQYCRIWSSSGSNSLTGWLAAKCRLQF